jgi:hypothetical protein
MKLNFPEQTGPSADAAPNYPRKLKHVLAPLPIAKRSERIKQNKKAGTTNDKDNFDKPCSSLQTTVSEHPWNQQIHQAV